MQSSFGRKISWLNYLWAHSVCCVHMQTPHRFNKDSANIVLEKRVCVLWHCLGLSGTNRQQLQHSIQLDGKVEQRKFALQSFVPPYRFSFIDSDKRICESTCWDDWVCAFVWLTKINLIYYMPAKSCIHNKVCQTQRSHAYIFMLSFQ